MLICEIIIGLVGIFTIITGRDMHDRMHGIFVVLLCLDGLCEHFFSHYNIVTEISLGVTAVYGLFFIIFFSIEDVHKRTLNLKKKHRDQKDNTKG
jgi:hypothetical protein